MTSDTSTDATSRTVRSHRGAVRGLRQAVLVQGPDTLAFLQGQLSQDIDRLAPGEVAWSLLLQPQGKISAWLRVTRSDDESFVLDVDTGWAEAVVGRLERFKLRTACEISVAPWTSVTVVGDRALGAELTGSEFEVVGSWSGVPTRDVFGSEVHIADQELVKPEVLEAVRIEAGVPRMGAELDDSTIPAAAGIVDQSVSFTKGCYTGQELVARIDSRGNNVPRRLVGLVIDDGEIPAVETSVMIDDGDKVVGVVTSAGFSAVLEQPICLLYAGRQIAVDARVRVGTSAGQIVGLPIVQA